MPNQPELNSSQINPQPPVKGCQMPPRTFNEASPRNGRAMNPSSIYLNVRLLNPYRPILWDFKVKGKDTIAKVKTELALRIAGFLKDGQPVFWNGQILDDKLTLDQYGIKNGDVLDVN
jgi:hypothetical protein